MSKRGRKRENLIGQKFGHLTVIDFAPDKNNGSNWLCKCDCENHTIKEVRGRHLKSGAIQSCGCTRGASLSMIRKKYNTYNLDGEYGIGYDDKMNEFYFDLGDYEKLTNHYWRKQYNGYFVALISPKNKTRIILMHRFLTSPPEDMEVDHINRHRNDNRKENLRICTHQENMQNTNRTYIPVRSLFYLEGYEELGFFKNRKEAVAAYKKIETSTQD